MFHTFQHLQDFLAKVNFQDLNVWVVYIRAARASPAQVSQQSLHLKSSHFGC